MSRVPPGRYRHFKGNEYEVLGSALHSETGEELVVYRALYGERRLFVRPRRMFVEAVVRDGRAQPRFAWAGPAFAGENRIGKLDAAGQARARTFLIEQARPLERALYRFHFEDGTAEEAAAALAAFRNADGGFGHGLEPDLQTPDSSALATALALRVLKEAGAGAEHPLVQGAVRWLVDNTEEGRPLWRIIPPTAGNAPHAPWWGQDGLEEAFGGFALNPRAEIAGLLHDYRRLVDGAWLALVTFSVEERILAHTGRMEMHDAVCCARLVATRTLPVDQRATLIAKLAPIMEAGVEQDPAQWAGYGLQPLQIVPEPGLPFAPQFDAALQANLDALIAQQGGDGAWSPAWAWGDEYPGAWAEARRAWQGILTLSALRSLAAWGRLAI